VLVMDFSDLAIWLQQVLIHRGEMTYKKFCRMMDCSGGTRSLTVEPAMLYSRWNLRPASYSA